MPVTPLVEDGRKSEKDGAPCGKPRDSSTEVISFRTSWEKLGRFAAGICNCRRNSVPTVSHQPEASTKHDALTPIKYVHFPPTRRAARAAACAKISSRLSRGLSHHSPGMALTGLMPPSGTDDSTVRRSTPRFTGERRFGGFFSERKERGIRTRSMIAPFLYARSSTVTIVSSTGKSFFCNLSFVESWRLHALAEQKSSTESAGVARPSIA